VPYLLQKDQHAIFVEISAAKIGIAKSQKKILMLIRNSKLWRQLANKILFTRC